MRVIPPIRKIWHSRGTGNAVARMTASGVSTACPSYVTGALLFVDGGMTAL